MASFAENPKFKEHSNADRERLHLAYKENDDPCQKQSHKSERWCPFHHFQGGSNDQQYEASGRSRFHGGKEVNSLIGFDGTQ